MRLTGCKSEHSHGAVGRPETADRVRSLFARGYQQPHGIELDLGKRIAEKA